MRRAALIALLLTACGGPTVTVVPADELPQDVYGPAEPANLTELPDATIVYLVDRSRVVPVERPLPEEAPSLPHAALQALLEGSSGVYGSAIPEGTRVLSLTVDGGVATVNLSDEFERSAPGARLALRVAQVVFTLTETPQVIAVLFEIDGTPVGVLTGSDQVVQRSVTRADYQRFAPKGDDAAA